MKIFEKIFNHTTLVDRPPVLVDIGASGDLYSHWKEIAKYAICIAFDPDIREMKHLKEGTSPYRELYINNSIVTESENDVSNFYLTASPFCSSTLKPKIDSRWTIAPLFKVENEVKLKTENLKRVIISKNISRIDWFKTDSQGTDLKIFKSLGKDIMEGTLVADFEPGIIEAYENEDKAWEVMQFMEKMDFWMSTMRVIGARKMPLGYEKFNTKLGNSLRSSTIESPGWTEISYINKGNMESFGTREYLLLWVFATIKKQYGFAFEIASNGDKKFNDPIFKDLIDETKIITTKIELYNRRTNKGAKIIRMLKNTVKKIL
ncbi:MAG: hypothetical protein EXS46_00585 [Candidatus Taylorbacteria bacterium]|nr:hypothetical protein [Candidatus Taylorbacteria bacterium]